MLQRLRGIHFDRELPTEVREQRAILRDRHLGTERAGDVVDELEAELGLDSGELFIRACAALAEVGEHLFHRLPWVLHHEGHGRAGVRRHEVEGAQRSGSSQPRSDTSALRAEVDGRRVLSAAANVAALENHVIDVVDAEVDGRLVLAEMQLFGVHAEQPTGAGVVSFGDAAAEGSCGGLADLQSGVVGRHDQQVALLNLPRNSVGVLQFPGEELIESSRRDFRNHREPVVGPRNDHGFAADVSRQRLQAVEPGKQFVNTLVLTAPPVL